MNDKPHVLVVDDDLAMCSFLRSFLGSRGYSAMTATNGEEAVLRFHTDDSLTRYDASIDANARTLKLGKFNSLSGGALFTFQRPTPDRLVLDGFEYQRLD